MVLPLASRYIPTMTVSDYIQAAAVLAAVGASIIALVIAAKDRRSAMRQQRLMFELDAARRLSILEARGGHTDSATSKEMGAETLALISLLGRDRVPKMWDRRVGKSEAELRKYVDNDRAPEWSRDAVEAALAMDQLIQEVRRYE